MLRRGQDGSRGGAAIIIPLVSKGVSSPFPGDWNALPAPSSCPGELQAITLDESKRLLALESVIETGRQAFLEVGNALLEIREARLYKAEHATFEAYCQGKWGFSRFYAHRIIEAAKVSAVLLPIGNIPTSEAQVRSLAGLPPDQQREAFAAAKESAGGEQPTGKQVEAAVAVIAPKKAPRYIPEDAGVSQQRFVQAIPAASQASC
jgi:hypothetical protein